MSEPYGMLTVSGRAAVAAALANNTALDVADIAWGAGTRAITGGEVSLQDETGRAPINAQGVDPDNANVGFFRNQFAAEDGPFVIGEAGLFSSDGTMLAIVTYPVPFSKPLNFALTFDILVAFDNLENLIINVQSAEAFVPAERAISAGEGLEGGGDLSQDRSIKLNFSGFSALAASAINLTNDTMVIWDQSVGAFKTVNLDVVAEKVLSTTRFADAVSVRGRWLIKSAAYTAKAGERVWADVSAGAWLLNLPAAPVAGDVVDFKINGGAEGGPYLTFDGNGKNINGDATMLVDHTAGDLPVSGKLIYIGTEWRVG
jgi:phage-related tail fiber protein